MKHYLPLIKSDAKFIEITWSDPVLLSEFVDPDVEYRDNGFFYKFVGVHGQTHRLFYLGQTYSRYVSNRIKDKDHRAKQNKFMEENPRHKIYVSVGFIPPIKKISKPLIRDIENLLIYTHSKTKKHPYFKNQKSTLSYRVISNYHIVNKGYMDDNMENEIFYGLFITQP